MGASRLRAHSYVFGPHVLGGLRPPRAQSPAVSNSRIAPRCGAARAETIRECIEREAWNEEKQSYVSAFGGSEIDAALLLMQEISYCSAW